MSQEIYQKRTKYSRYTFKEAKIKLINFVRIREQYS